MTEEHSSSIRICQEGHANAIALNKEYTQIAVAGRSLLKVYSIDVDGFSEVCNMRGGKNQNLSYSSNDVAWSSLDSNLLATAATNGVVSVWDLSKFGRQKQLYVYSEHERTAHTVTFHGTEPNLLISGSQDGTIKCFDLRIDKAVHTYCSNSESVRDVKFSPQYPNTFAAVSESGTIQLWDLKRPDKCQLQFTAHSGPIYTCDWHPTQPWLATGSRDKQIKIWNMEQKPLLEYTIHTIAVVGRIKWRPDKMYHIASCALVVDYCIYVWDIRRPYIPYVAFNKHTNVTTGIAWKGNDPHILLSSSKDSTVHKHSFRDASRPNDRANPQSTSISHTGDMLFSYKIKNMQPVTVPSTAKTNFMNSKPKQQIMRDQFHLAKSCLVNYNKIISSKDPLATTNLHKDFNAFKGLAKEYLLWGKTLSELCEHNAEIAKKYGKSNVAMLWKFVKNQYTSPKLNQNAFELRKVNINPSSLPNRKHLLQSSNAITTGWGEELSKLTSEEAIAKMCFEDIKHQDFRHPKSGEFKHTTNMPMSNLIQNALTAADTESSNNFMYGEAELTVNCVKGLRNGFLYIGPHDLTKLWSLPSSSIVGHELQTAKDEELTREQEKMLSVEHFHKRSSVIDPSDPTNVLRVIHPPKQNQWQPHDVLAEGLTLQTEVGDVQTSVCILTVLGERRNELPIEKIVQEYWLLSYIELLHHHQLWNEATEIINFSWLRSVYELNQNSTTMHTNCGDCGKPFAACGWYCQKCKSSRSSKCAVCNRIVTGLYAWCQGCSHGGHLMHMKEWFSNHTNCPKCAHLCEYE